MKAFQKLALAIGLLILATTVVVIRARLSKPTAQPQLQREEPSPNLAARAGKHVAEKPMAQRPVTPPPEAKEAVIIAKVNGVPLTEQDVLGSGGPLSLPGDPAARAQFLKRMLDDAIDRELLRQYWVKMGLDETPEYKQARAQRERFSKRMEAESLASLYESRNEELKSLRESHQATGEEVEEYYQQNRDYYAGLPEDRARDDIRSMLSAQKYKAEYKEWAARTIAGVPVLVNGQAVPLDVLRSALGAMIGPGMGSDGLPTRAGSFNDLAEFVRTATGATDSPGGSREPLMEAEIQVGSNVIELEELFPGPIFPPGMPIPPAASPSVEQILRGSGLIASIKSYAWAEKAKQEGLDSSEEFREKGRVPARLPTMPSPEMMNQQLIAEMVWQHKGLASPESVQVSDQEIEQHIAANPSRYRDVLPKEDGEKTARMIARQTISYDKLRQQKEAFLKELRASATIEVLDERFK